MSIRNFLPYIFKSYTYNLYWLLSINRKQAAVSIGKMYGGLFFCRKKSANCKQIVNMEDFMKLLHCSAIYIMRGENHTQNYCVIYDPMYNHCGGEAKKCTDDISEG